MKRWLLLFVFIFLISTVLAECNSTQIDINSASASELKKIAHVGSTVAGYIIDARPFSSLDDLSNVQWLGSRPSYIADIKAQGLACVSNSNQTTSNNSSNQTSNVNSSAQEQNNTQSSTSENNYVQTTTSVQQETTTPATHDVIKLTSDTESQNSSSSTTTNRLPIYGLIAFCVILGGLFLARKFKTKRYKSEFE